MMKTYRYNEYSEESNHNLVIEMTEKDILNEYWEFWSRKMIEKYGEGHELITEENCIDDWVVVNWAWEKKDA